MSTHLIVLVVFICSAVKSIQKNYSTIIWVVVSTLETNKTKQEDFPNHSLGLKRNALGSVSII